MTEHTKTLISSVLSQTCRNDYMNIFKIQGKLDFNNFLAADDYRLLKGDI